MNISGSLSYFFIHGHGQALDGHGRLLCGHLRKTRGPGVFWRQFLVGSSHGDVPGIGEKMDRNGRVSWNFYRISMWYWGFNMIFMGYLGGIFMGILWWDIPELEIWIFWGCPKSWGYPLNGWFTRENPMKIWMMTGGTPISGNHHGETWIEMEEMENSIQFLILDRFW